MWFKLSITCLLTSTTAMCSWAPQDGLNEMPPAEIIVIMGDDYGLPRGELPAFREGKTPSPTSTAHTTPAPSAVEEQPDDVDEYGLPRERKKWKRPTASAIIMFILGGVITKFVFC